MLYFQKVTDLCDQSFQDIFAAKTDTSCEDLISIHPTLGFYMAIPVSRSMYRYGSLPSRMIRTSLKGGNIRIAPSPVAICFWRTSRISLVIDSKATVHPCSPNQLFYSDSPDYKATNLPGTFLLSHKHLLPGTSSWRSKLRYRTCQRTSGNQ